MTMTPPPGRPYPYSQIDDLFARPGLDAAIRHSVRGAVAYYDAAPTLHRNAKDIGRFLLGVVALYLDAKGGLTHRGLRELSGKSGILSTGTATAVLMRLQLIGYVTRAESANGHSRIYTPTPAMAGAFRERLRIEFEAIGHLTAETASLLARLEEPGVFPALIVEMGEQAMLAAGAPNPDIKALNALAVRSAGLLILFDVLVQADQGDAFPPASGEVEVSVAALSRRFEVSRSHVLSVLRDLEQAGLLRRGADSVWTLTPALRDSVRTFYAITYLGLIRAAERVLAEQLVPARTA